MEHLRVTIIGAGQAGLSLSRELTRRDVEHVVLERGRTGQSWRDRWDSFCLVTPNWTVQLPDGAYDGPDPDGYLDRDEIVTFLERYADAIDAPVREGVEVRSIDPSPDGGFTLGTSAGEVRTERVAIASGAYQHAIHPHAETLPGSITQMDVADYRHPGSLPDGGVLVVGSGQSGLQIAEELSRAGRDVAMACGRAPWMPRRVGGRDFVWWLVHCGFLDQPVSALPSPADRLTANVQNSGARGGHDLNYRVLRDAGVELVGRFLGASGDELRFAPDLGASVAWGDERYRMLATLFRRHAAEQGIPAPDMPEPEPFDGQTAESLPLDRFRSVLYAGGYRPGYRALVPWADAFDDLGFPIHVDGESEAVPGLHFIGVHFLRTRKSSLLLGVGEDAAIVADRIAAG
ncbi:MAG: NAD(P)-binding domain-containing protein [Chloroflexi bacterium]|nr:NAD(P)-binding domain-containing protein [Chloroflexota bacterium]